MSSMRITDEAGWASCSVPGLMLLALEDRGKQGLISRELRLFACGCVRQIGKFIEDGRSWQAVDVAERYADGNASEDELKAAYHAAELVEPSIRQRIGGQATEEWWLLSIPDWHLEGRLLNAASAASRCADIRIMSSNVDPELVYPGDWHSAASVALYAYKSSASHDRLASEEAAFLATGEENVMYEDGWQADLVRCVFRSPFRHIDADKLDVEPWIRDIAEAIYSLRAFDRMPILGRELEASGYVNSDLVAHCVQSSVHARGCWALDMARGLGRER